MSNTNYQVTKENAFKPDLESIRNTLKTSRDLIIQLKENNPVTAFNDEGQEVQLSQEEILGIVLTQLFCSIDDIDEMQIALFSLVNGVIGGGYEDDTVH